MSISYQEFAQRLQNGWKAVIAAKPVLTEIDSRFGDADHGVTMEKISEACLASVDAKSQSIRELLGSMATAIMMINGGSAVPLWFTLIQGMSDAAPDSDRMTEAEMQQMFQAGLKAMQEITRAKVGDKTMMDALIPAVEAIAAAAGTSQEILGQGAAAAAKGAEATRGFVSKFGRARSYGEQTIGTPDVGAVSMKSFFAGLAGKADLIA